MVHNTLAFCVSQKLPTKTDKPTSWDFKLDSCLTITSWIHSCHLSFFLSKLFNNNPSKLIRNINNQVLIRLKFNTIFFFDDYFWTTKRKLKTFSSHIFSKDCDLKFTTTTYFKLSFTCIVIPHSDICFHLSFKSLIYLI